MFQHFENDITANHPEIPGINTPDFIAGASVNTPQQTIQRRWQFRDDLSFRKEGWAGDHNFKAGAEVLLSHYGGFFIPTLYGYFIFNNPIPGAHSVSDYANAIADTFTGSAGTNVANDDWSYVAGYIQDDWKPTPRLTLNLGLRWEIQTGPYANKFQSVGKAALEAVGYNGQLKNDWNNFGPRVGFAYDVKGDATVVVRGGYGRYYDEIFQNITLYEAWSDPSTPLNFVSASPSPWTPAYFAANRDTIRNSFLDPSFAGQPVRLTAPNLRQPYAQHANGGLSLAPSRYVAFDIDYVWSGGRDEVHRWRVNTPQNVNTLISPAGVFDPAYGPFLVEGNRGHSSFNGVYFAAKARSTKLSGIATYTWSKAKNVSNDFNSQPGDITNANWDLDYGPTPNDIRHRVTAGLVYQLPAGLPDLERLPVQHRQALQRARRPRRPAQRRARHRPRHGPDVHAELLHGPELPDLGRPALEDVPVRRRQVPRGALRSVQPHEPREPRRRPDLRVHQHVHLAQLRHRHPDRPQQPAAGRVRRAVRVLTRDDRSAGPAA